MGLLDTVAGALGAAPGGGQGDPLQAILGLLGHGGGLAGVVRQLQQGGLAEAVSSWISTGPNLPVSPAALGHALNPEAVAGFARQLGLNPNDALGTLSKMLPQVVDKLTPDGRLPPGSAGSAGGLGDLAGMLGGLLNKS